MTLSRLRNGSCRRWFSMQQMTTLPPNSLTMKRKSKTKVLLRKNHTVSTTMFINRHHKTSQQAHHWPCWPIFLSSWSITVCITRRQFSLPCLLATTTHHSIWHCGKIGGFSIKALLGREATSSEYSGRSSLQFCDKYFISGGWIIVRGVKTVYGVRYGIVRSGQVWSRGKAKRGDGPGCYYHGNSQFQQVGFFHLGWRNNYGISLEVFGTRVLDVD
ncbi:hypothetical protein QBC35DRAFT_296217 [Podospora australis]|uniref:Uncharacterized protein n=1 Tax=Podospora australis TaxID=1536484 RepID=A0AAN7AM26_9PEZI|nr:hypothetical protein QBC35DRAFT_296217 [Podospora australis]